MIRRALTVLAVAGIGLLSSSSALATGDPCEPGYGVVCPSPEPSPSVPPSPEPSPSVGPSPSAAPSPSTSPRPSPSTTTPASPTPGMTALPQTGPRPGGVLARLGLAAALAAAGAGLLYAARRKPKTTTS